MDRPRFTHRHEFSVPKGDSIERTWQWRSAGSPWLPVGWSYQVLASPACGHEPAIPKGNAEQAIGGSTVSRRPIVSIGGSEDRTMIPDNRKNAVTESGSVKHDRRVPKLVGPSQTVRGTPDQAFIAGGDKDIITKDHGGDPSSSGNEALRGEPPQAIQADQQLAVLAAAFGEESTTGKGASQAGRLGIAGQDRQPNDTVNRGEQTRGWSGPNGVDKESAVPVGDTKDFINRGARSNSPLNRIRGRPWRASLLRGDRTGDKAANAGNPGGYPPKDGDGFHKLRINCPDEVIVIYKSQLKRVLCLFSGTSVDSSIPSFQWVFHEQAVLFEAPGTPMTFTANNQSFAPGHKKPRTSSKTSAGAITAMPLARPGYMFENNTIKLALIGCGGRGAGAVVNALATQNAPVKLIAMADLFDEHLASSCLSLWDHKPQVGYGWFLKL
jgi:hypothetical protein